MLRPENGDRLGVNDKLVLLTDGLSDIRPDLVEETAMVNLISFFVMPRILLRVLCT